MLKKSSYVKLRIGVPVTHADALRIVLGDAGAGVQGHYSHCSSSYRVTGRFLPLVGATPAIGKIGKHETVEEEVIEVLCHKDILKKVIAEVKKAHPYEEPPIDILPRFELE